MDPRNKDHIDLLGASTLLGAGGREVGSFGAFVVAFPSAMTGGLMAKRICDLEVKYFKSDKGSWTLTKTDEGPDRGGCNRQRRERHLRFDGGSRSIGPPLAQAIPKMQGAMTPRKAYKACRKGKAKGGKSPDSPTHPSRTGTCVGTNRVLNSVGVARGCRRSGTGRELREGGSARRDACILARIGARW